MKAVICLSGIFIEISLSAFFSPYQSERSSMRRIGFSIRGSSAGSRSGFAALRPGRSGLGHRSVLDAPGQTALPAYLRRRWLRSMIATRFISVTTRISSRAVAKTSGVVASTLGLWKPTS